MAKYGPLAAFHEPNSPQGSSASAGPELLTLGIVDRELVGNASD